MGVFQQPPIEKMNEILASENPTDFRYSGMSKYNVSNAPKNRTMPITTIKNSECLKIHALSNNISFICLIKE